MGSERSAERLPVLAAESSSWIVHPGADWQFLQTKPHRLLEASPLSPSGWLCGQLPARELSGFRRHCWSHARRPPGQKLNQETISVVVSFGRSLELLCWVGKRSLWIQLASSVGPSLIGIFSFAQEKNKSALLAVEGVGQVVDVSHPCPTLFCVYFPGSSLVG